MKPAKQVQINEKGNNNSNKENISKLLRFIYLIVTPEKDYCNVCRYPAIEDKFLK